MNLDSKIPEGPLSEKWSNHKFNMRLVNPANRRKYHVIVVGSGLAGSSAAASLAEQGYNVSCFCYQDSSEKSSTVLQPKVESMQPRITKMMGIAYNVYFMIQSKEGITAQEKPMCIV